MDYIVGEITLAIEELKAGMYENVYTRLTELNNGIIGKQKS